MSLDFTDEAAEMAVEDGLEHGAEFGGLALKEEFDAAVGKVADGAGEIKAGADLFDGVAEANTLNAPGVEEPLCLHPG